MGPSPRVAHTQIQFDYAFLNNSLYLINRGSMQQQHLLGQGPPSFPLPSFKMEEDDGANAMRSRKPYVVSRPRERWSEPEHDRFLEALRLFGRQWAKVEEHIGARADEALDGHTAIRPSSGGGKGEDAAQSLGQKSTSSTLRVTSQGLLLLSRSAGTKTAVQIRSHAQKFFAKQQGDGGQ